jgi:hypothetical protein
MLALGWKWSLSLWIPKFIGSNPAMDTNNTPLVKMLHTHTPTPKGER